MRKAKLPDKPGVYVFLDRKGGILYIGRANSLKNRVASYFGKDLDPRIKEMVGVAVKIRHYITDTIFDSYILEANLIKKHLGRCLFSTMGRKIKMNIGFLKSKMRRQMTT